MAKTPVIKQDATKGKFKDSEMEKVKPKESLDDMFENLDGDVPAASTDTAAPAPSTDDAAPAAEEGEGDELDALLKKIAVETTEAKDAAEEVKTVTDNPQSTPEDIKKVVEDYEAKMATLTQTVSDVTRERDLERKRSGDLLEQKFQIESDAQEKGKIYDEVM